MEKFSVRDAKLVSIIISILLVFALVVGNAYKYLPEQSDELPDVNTEINLPAEEEESQTTETANNKTEEEISVKKNLYKNDSLEEATESKEVITNEKLTPLENIDDEGQSTSIQTEKESYEEIILKGNRLKSEKQFVNALTEYKKALSIAENSKQKAECYEEMANIYALAKRYGTALAYAQKAYNLNPSTKREVLLARLYYKTGEVDKASDRVNNVLRRDFTQDN